MISRKKITIIILLLGIFFQQNILGDNATYPLITNIENRAKTSLDGEWKYIVDPMETGYLDYRKKELKSGYFKDRPQKNPELIEYDFDASPSIRVPGDWNTQKENLWYYEGTVWYRKTFDYSLLQGNRLFLHFGAVNYSCIVFLNGNEIGRHEGGFTPFNFEITEKIKSGKNSLVLKVNNSRKIENIPTDIFDWWNYGGITRSVNLIETPRSFIRDYFIQLPKDNKESIAGWIQADGLKEGEKISVIIPELKQKIKIVADNNGHASFEIKAKPELWSPENPKLYSVSVATENYSISDAIGFRTIETKGNKIVLNGKVVFCRGACIHEEAPIRGGRAYTKEDACILLGWAKEMGCNFARLAHYTHNENMIREAERMGIMLWSEIPVYWTIQWDNPNVLQNAKNQMNEMITRDKNRCNIIIWSVANETPQGDSRLKFLNELISYTRSLDNTRLVSAALEKEKLNDNLLTVHDDLSKHLDVLSFNQYIGWYGGTPEKCDVTNWQLSQDKPIFITEYGGGAVAGKHGDKSERWTEEFQEDLYIKTIKMFERMDGLTGTTPWILMDFSSFRRLYSGIQDEYNRKGLISNYGEKKKAFYVMQNWYQKLKDKDK